MLTLYVCAEAGEDDTRDTRERDAGASAQDADLCAFEVVAMKDGTCRIPQVNVKTLQVGPLPCLLCHPLIDHHALTDYRPLIKLSSSD